MDLRGESTRAKVVFCIASFEMGIIIRDFSKVLPYLKGSKFDENYRLDFENDGIVAHRTEVLLDACRGKRVLHIGCCDHVPLIKSKLASGDWLHALITECSEFTVGIDIDADAVREASRISGLNNIFTGDITSETLIPEISEKHFDIVLFGEVLEHISNPVSFLQRFRENYGKAFEKIIITVPNAFRAGNVRGALKSSETINSDHRFFFSPYTISKVALDAGFLPLEITMATFTRASRLKTFVLNRAPLLAEDIIYVGTHTGRPN